MTKLSDADIRTMTGPARKLDASEIPALQEAVRSTSALFMMEISKIMDRALAVRVRQLRVDEGCSWRRVAEIMYAETHARSETVWQPPSNQLAGMAFCRLAAQELGEDPNAEPWN